MECINLTVSVGWRPAHFLAAKGLNSTTTARLQQPTSSESTSSLQHQPLLLTMSCHSTKYPASGILSSLLNLGQHNRPWFRSTKPSKVS